MIAGPLANFLLSIIFIAIAFLVVGIPTPSTVIESLPKCLNINDSNKNCIKATAVSSGILANDKIVGIEDKKIKNWDDFIYYIDIYKGGNVNLVIERDNIMLSKEVEILEYNSRGYIGVVPKIDYKQGSIIMVYKVVNDMFDRTLSAIARFPERIIEVSKIVFTDQKRDPNGPIGIVGLTRVSGEIAQGDDPDKEKILSILFLLAGLNMSLFIFNLIPLVPLDGGNAFAAILEYLKRLYNKAVGRKDEFYLDPAKYIYLTYLIAIILITTSFLLIIADIFKPISIS
jgi:membrane-associated protease RseP (regulator of RpoE activity)